MLDELKARFDHVESLFMRVCDYVESNFADRPMDSWLTAQSVEYSSIVFESASYAIAGLSLANKNNLQDWRPVYETHKDRHGPHILIGLGWALAKNGTDPENMTQKLDSHELSLVYDGIGYYHALFKGRATLKTQQYPPNMLSHQASFDQGVGRRLWYHSRGDVNLLGSMIGDFDLTRHPALWRGVGIACAYVGGCDEALLTNLSERARENHAALTEGVATGILARHRSETMTIGSLLAHRVICGAAFQPSTPSSENKTFHILSI